MARTVRKSGMKEVPLSEIKDDLSRFLREAENRDWRRSATFAVETATSHFRGATLPQWGRLVKAPAFVVMYGWYVMHCPQGQGVFAR